MHKHNSWATLTYDDDQIPKHGTLRHSDYQRFMKRLRKNTGLEVRYYMCGEYGENTGRPHYHTCLFGVNWPDRKKHTENAQGDSLYTSEILNKLWGHGHTLTSELTFENAAYTARYCVQKHTGWRAEEHYTRLTEEGPVQIEPEYNRMSLKPGIGATWFDKYQKDIYTNDYAIVRGKKTKPPKFYDELYAKLYPDKMEDIKETRIMEAYKLRHDNTDERLRVKEIVKLAALRQLERTL